MNGVVVKIVPDRKFGFILGENDGKEYFFHQEDLNGFFPDLAEDFAAGRKVKVTFELVESQKGLRAGNVTRLDGGV